MKKIRTVIIFGLVFLLMIVPNYLIVPFQAYNQAPEDPPVVPSDLLCFLLPGDLIFMDFVPDEWIENYGMLNVPSHGIKSNDHVVLYVGTRPGWLGNDWCIHNGDPTRYTSLYGHEGENYFFMNGNYANFSIYRVQTASLEEKNAAIEWVKLREQQGCEYQTWFEFPFNGNKEWDNVHFHQLLHPNADKFYCSELVWAAYYNTTWWENHDYPLAPIIDIDCNEFEKSLLRQVCVNMGYPNKLWPNNWDPPANPGDLFYNEIKMDSDMEKIFPFS